MIKTISFKNDALTLLGIFKDELGISFLHSSQSDVHRGRFSFLGFNPFACYQYSGPQSLKQIQKHFRRFKNSQRSNLTPFISGMMGFASYDYGLYSEKIKIVQKKPSYLPDVCFGFYDTILTVDHFKKRLVVSTSEISKSKANQKIDYVLQKINRFNDKDFLEQKNRLVDNVQKLVFKSNFTKKEYVHTVNAVLKYIRQGDIYQANISQKLSLDLKQLKLSPIQLYQNLMQYSPSPFSAYFDAGDFQVISSSPERFLKLSERDVETRPMKGTRPRSGDKIKDQKLKQEIQSSVKDRAELLMITDLERNDLGRVCEYGSVKVKNIRTIEKYRTVYQATSTIVGKLRKDKNGFDLINAAFPGGSITGCPKIRAMEIIEELEPTRRGLYTGSLGYMDFNGDLDFNILIRTMVMNQKRIDFQVGGGIVADSVAEKEYEETLVKAKAMIECLEMTVGNL